MRNPHHFYCMWWSISVPLLLLLSHFSRVQPTLYDPIDGSPPGSSAHGLFQARALEWGPIAFSICATGANETGWNLSHHLRLTDTWTLTFPRIFAFWEYLGNLSQLSPSSLSIGQTLFLSSRLPHSRPAPLPTCCPREKAQETTPKGGPPHLWLSRGKGSGGDGRETWERGDTFRIKIKD